MTNKKACGAILFASALMAMVMFILGSGCGGGGSGSDLDVPPRESFFTPIYHPSNGGSFGNPRGISLGNFFRFLYQDDDRDGVSGQEDNLYWGGAVTWTDSDRISEGRMVLRKDEVLDQYVVALFNTFGAAIPEATPDPVPFRWNGWSTIRVREGWEPPEDRGGTLPFKSMAPSTSVEAHGHYADFPAAGTIPTHIGEHGLQDRYEMALKRARVENYLSQVHWGGVDPDEIARLAGLSSKPLQQPITPTPSPLAKDLTPAQLAALSPGDIVYFSVVGFFIEAEVQAVSPNSIIFADTDTFIDYTDPDVEAAIAYLQNEFDARISPRARLFFGNSDAATYTGPPGMDLVETGVGDVDADGRVTILITPLALAIGGGGFFLPYDLLGFDNTFNPITNEMNMVYVAEIDDFFFTKEGIAEVLAHEYTHLIHFIEKTFRRVANIYGDLPSLPEYLTALADPNINEPEVWVREGFGVLAQDILGYSTDDFIISPIGRAYAYFVDDSFEYPGFSLTENTHALNADGLGYMWFRYLMEQCGGMRFATTWQDDSDSDTDYVAERIGTAEKGIDFLRAVIGRKEVGLEVVQAAFSQFDTHGGRNFLTAFQDFLAMMILDNAKRYAGTALNSDARYNLDRNAVWPGGVDLTTGMNSGMRTHQTRLLLLSPGNATIEEIDGPNLYYFDTGAGFQGTTDAGGGASHDFGYDSPAVWYVLFQPNLDYNFTGEFGTAYDSMEFFFGGDTPWSPLYGGYESGVMIIRVENMQGDLELGDTLD